MIALTRSQQGLSGKNGTYYKLNNNVGVKVIHSKEFKNVTKAFRSKAYREAVEEACLLSEAYETGYVPQCYGVTLVKMGAGYKVGVLMQHLGNTTLSESEFYDDAEIYNDINNSLKDLGIYHGDLNEDNIMVYRGKFYAIDFSPDCVKIK